MKVVFHQCCVPRMSGDDKQNVDYGVPRMSGDEPSSPWLMSIDGSPHVMSVPRMSGDEPDLNRQAPRMSGDEPAKAVDVTNSCVPRMSGDEPLQDAACFRIKTPENVFPA